MVKISDKRLAVLHKTLMLGVVLWATLSIIITHAYMITENPHITANFWVDSYMEGSSFNESQARRVLPRGRCCRRRRRPPGCARPAHAAPLPPRAGPQLLQQPAHGLHVQLHLHIHEPAVRHVPGQ